LINFVDVVADNLSETCELIWYWNAKQATNCTRTTTSWLQACCFYYHTEIL